METKHTMLSPNYPLFFHLCVQKQEAILDVASSAFFLSLTCGIVSCTCYGYLPAG